jgi:hypothetical protein
VVVTVLSTAASILPIPGGAAVRTVALSNGGKAYGAAIRITVLVGLSWVGVAAAIACGGFLLMSMIHFAVIAAAISLTALTIALVPLRTGQRAGVSQILGLLTTQFLLAAVGGTRLALCFEALGKPLQIEQAMVLILAPVVSAIIGVAPGGLGLTELTAAGLAALIGVPAAVAFIAAALNRLTGLIFIAPVALILRALDSAVNNSDKAAKK